MVTATMWRGRRRRVARLALPHFPPWPGLPARPPAALWSLLTWDFLARRLPPRLGPLTGYLAAGSGVAAVSVLIALGHAALHGSNFSALYLVVVLATAIRFGRWPAIAASVAAFLVYDWFFILPLHTFTIARPEEWLSLITFLVVAVVASQLAAVQRQRADEAQRREREAVALHTLGRLLHASDDLDSSLQAVAEHLRVQLGLSGCAVLTPGAAPGSAVQARAIAGAPPPAAEAEAAPWKVATTGDGATSGRARWIRVRRPERATRDALRVSFVPLRAGDQVTGMLRLAVPPERGGWTREEQRLLDAAGEQIGLAIERTRLRRAATEAEVLRQAEEARQAVLASVSHDLRTPLASIQASAESLLQEGVAWSPAEQHGFLSAIVQETGRMNRLVENLLDMSRIEAGRLRSDIDLYPLDTLVDDVLARLEPVTAGHRLTVDVPDDLPPVPLDYVQIGEVLANLIENAVKYTPRGSHIAVCTRVEDEHAVLTVQDDGPGIPAAALPHVFEKFFRAQGSDTARVRGTGLGLAIARGYVEAHGGTLTAASPPPGTPSGTVFTVRLPCAEARTPAPPGTARLTQPAGWTNGVDKPGAPVAPALGGSDGHS